MLKIALPTDHPEGLLYYKDALRQCGAEPVAGSGFSPEGFDGLLLPGGIDLNPVHYGEEAIPATEYNDALDALQLDAFRRFLAAGLPVFGICRGHQLINVALGGSLIQDLPTAAAHKRNAADEDSVHLCVAEAGSRIAGLYGERFAVNSSHHQGVARPGSGLRVVLRAEDGVAEALEHESLPVWSVQFHPERMCFDRARADTVDGSLLFRFFLKKCENRNP